MATRLRIEPYNRNAVDADNDGIVQEGTAFERPAGTNIVDEVGNIIEEGVVAAQRAANFRVVDRNGRDVDYTPTYGTDATATTTALKPRSFFGATLGERGGTLQSLGGGSLGDRFGTLGGGRPKSKRPKFVPSPTTRLAQERVTDHFDIALGSMEPEMRERAKGARARVKELVGNISETTGIDRGSLETLAVGGTYWATFLFGGSQLSGLVNDITTGLGDADVTSDVSQLIDFVSMAGMPGLRASMLMSLESLGIDPAQAQEFFANIGDGLRNLGASFGELSRQMLEALEKIMQEIIETFFAGPPPVLALAKSLEDDIEVKARARLKLEPYNPDAADADNDGIVQEGTAWERPAATTLVDAFGDAIKPGKMSGNRPAGTRVVDKDGNAVSYLPTYMQPQRSRTDGPPTSGMRTVGQTVRDEPSEKPAKPAPPEPNPFELPKVWKAPRPYQGELPKQEYDTPLLGQPMVRGTAPTTDLIDPSDGRYIPERRELHRKIINHLLAEARQKQKPRKPGEKPQIFFLGGGSGSGKSRLRKSGAGDIPTDLAALDPDTIKEMIPEYRKWVAEGNPEAAAMVHEESKHIFELATAQAMEDELDFVYDTTGNGDYRKMRKSLERMREKGYSVKAKYVTISTPRALSVNDERYKKTGRKVPPHQVMHSHEKVTENLIRAIADGLFDELDLYDNNTPETSPFIPILKVRDGRPRIDRDRRDMWLSFLGKASKEGYFGRMPPGGIWFDEEDAGSGFADSMRAIADRTGEYDHFETLDRYIAEGYWSINTTLRDPEYLDDDEYNRAAADIARLDQVFEEASVGLATPQNVFRGTRDIISIGDLGLLDDDERGSEIEDFLNKGGDVGSRPDILQMYVDTMNKDLEALGGRMSFTEEGFSSTTAEIGIAEDFAGGTTKATGYGGEDDFDMLAIPSIMEIELRAGARYVPGSAFEQERILPRGMEYRVVGYEVVEITGGRYAVKVIVRGKQPKEPPKPLELVEIDDD